MSNYLTANGKPKIILGRPEQIFGGWLKIMQPAVIFEGFFGRGGLRNVWRSILQRKNIILELGKAQW